jgi:hypothetical protein
VDLMLEVKAVGAGGGPPLEPPFPQTDPKPEKLR